jgi:hypothetical protein
MSQYLKEISAALVRVFNQALQIHDHRIVGHAANVDFWADEVAHCLVAIDGFPVRQQAFAEALKREIRAQRERTRYADPLHLRYGEATTDDDMRLYRSDAARLHKEVTTAAGTLFRKLHREDLSPTEKWWTLVDRFPFLDKSRRRDRRSGVVE